MSFWGTTAASTMMAALYEPDLWGIYTGKKKGEMTIEKVKEKEIETKWDRNGERAVSNSHGWYKEEKLWLTPISDLLLFSPKWKSRREDI